MHVLVTGGAGFIGSNIVRYHLERGDEVWTVDNLQTGRIENVNSYIGTPSFRFDEADLCIWPKLSEAVKWADRIYHMAAVVGQKLVLSHPVDTITSNIKGCEVILQSMADLNSQARLLVASTAEVYSHTPEDLDKPFCEGSPLKIQGNLLQETYPLSKIVNEVMALAYAREKGIHCTIARLFNAIGTNQTGRYGMVVPTFVDQALRQVPITVYDKGLQTRSFCNVRDSVEALSLLLDTPKSNGEVVNVGNDHETTILELAQIVRERAHSKSEITFTSFEEAYGCDFKDPQRRRPSLEKLFQLTGFRPKWTLEQSIDEIIAFQRAKVEPVKK